MTVSWAINTFIIGCVILMVVPVIYYLYKEIITVKIGDTSDI